MELILLQRVEGLGNVGDEVNVRPGYARNYLIPQGKALPATEANRRLFERRRQQLEALQRDELEKAQAEAAALADLSLTITRATSDGEHLYGSVSTVDLARLLEEAGHPVERRQIILDEPIKKTGKHAFRVRLHPDVIAELHIKVEADRT